VRRPAAKVDPKFLAAARELRDRYLEHVNANDTPARIAGKYDVGRMIAGNVVVNELPAASPKQLPAPPVAA
jgi:hypothetical protein